MSILKDFVTSKAEGKKISTSEWLQCIHKLNKCSLATHIGKFINKNSKVYTCVDYDEKLAHQGYLMTAACPVDLDIVYDNAANMAPAPLMMLPLEDGETVFRHIMAGDAQVLQEFEELGLPADELMQEIDKFNKNSGDISGTEEMLKQVFFPIDIEHQEDHLLTLLPASSMAETITRKVKEMTYNAIKVRKNKDADEFKEVKNCTIRGLGGTNSRNVSNYCAKHKDGIYLLDSVPPIAEKRKLRYPKNNFYNVIPKIIYEEYFESLYKLLNVPVRNVHIRNSIDNLFTGLAKEVLWYSSLYTKSPGWTKDEKYIGLKKCYKKMLDPTMYEPLSDMDRSKIANDFSLWVKNKLSMYHKDHRAYALGDAEMMYLSKIMNKVMKKRGI